MIYPPATWQLEDDSAPHQSQLTSSDPYMDGTRVVEPYQWWDYYVIDVVNSEPVTVIVKVVSSHLQAMPLTSNAHPYQNLEDSGIFRGYVDVMMAKNQYPDHQNNEAVYSTATRDSVQVKSLVWSCGLLLILISSPVSGPSARCGKGRQSLYRCTWTRKRALDSIQHQSWRYGTHIDHLTC